MQNERIGERRRGETRRHHCMWHLTGILDRSNFTTMKTAFEGIFKLGRAEKLQLVEDLWDSIDDDAPVTDAVRDELRRRKKRFEKNPGSGRTWEQVKSRARKMT
jgi:putative addiction module component (TIGR02574 family)